VYAIGGDGMLNRLKPEDGAGAKCRRGRQKQAK
jgi:hypothetical protein